LASRIKPGSVGAITPVETERAAGAYLQIVRDIHDFCGAKGIAFHAFLQPVRWYAPEGEDRARLGADIMMGRLYAQFDEGFKKNEWSTSLTSAMEGNIGDYMDDCHVDDEGNRALSAAIAQDLLGALVRDPVTGRVRWTK
jgi:hypothetical protein